MKTTFSSDDQANIRDGIKFGLGAERVLFKYVRNEDKQPVGIVVALKGGKFGWSKCRVEKGDSFNKAFGYEIAVRRALHGSKVHIPPDVEITLESLKGRAKAYFKEGRGE